MSSYGEDIIRETFEKFGDAIGVQMQMPAAMITNLGAVLQAQIDLLAELQSAGRLIPAGGMALTAEQMEDVRALVWLDGRRNFDAFYRLRALFPATEPAEERCQSVSIFRERCALVSGHDGRHAANGCAWGYPPAPAEPAEEETKAEARPPLLTPNQIRDANPGKHQTYIYGQQSADGTACIGCNWETRNILPVSEAVMAHDSAKNWTHDHSVWIAKNGKCPCGQPTSSPVVPAPTETEAGHA